VEPIASHVKPPPARADAEVDGTVLLRVAPADAERILRALDEASVRFGPAPGGARGASVYRRLAANIRSQAHVTPTPYPYAV
jgi:hypothetical protein